LTTRPPRSPRAPQVKTESDITLARFAQHYGMTPHSVALLNPQWPSDGTRVIPAGTEMTVMRSWAMNRAGTEKLTFFIDIDSLFYCTRHALIRTVNRLVENLHEEAQKLGGAAGAAACAALRATLATVIGKEDLQSERESQDHFAKFKYNMSNGTQSELILAARAALIAAVFKRGTPEYDALIAIWDAYATLNSLQQQQAIEEADIERTHVAARLFFVLYHDRYPDKITPYIAVQGEARAGRGRRGHARSIRFGPSSLALLFPPSLSRRGARGRPPGARLRGGLLPRPVPERPVGALSPRLQEREERQRRQRGALHPPALRAGPALLFPAVLLAVGQDLPGPQPRHSAARRHPRDARPPVRGRAPHR